MPLSKLACVVPWTKWLPAVLMDTERACPAFPVFGVTERIWRATGRIVTPTEFWLANGVPSPAKPARVARYAVGDCTTTFDGMRNDTCREPPEAGVIVSADVLRTVPVPGVAGCNVIVMDPGEIKPAGNPSPPSVTAAPGVPEAAAGASVTLTDDGPDGVTVNPAPSEICSLPVLITGVRGPAAAAESIATLAIAWVGLITVTVPNPAAGPPFTDVPAPKLACVEPGTKFENCATMATEIALPGAPEVGLMEIN